MYKPKCVLVTGGSAGIGKGLAEAFYKRGAKVIIGGRREAPLRGVTEANPGMEFVTLDVADSRSVQQAVHAIERWCGDLDCLVNNAGVQRLLNFAGEQPEPKSLREEIDTNFTGLVHTTSAFLPFLLQRAEAKVINISSGLAFVPLASRPVYCATKAAVHSFTISLRHQLTGTGVQIVEIAPPLVLDTDLHEGQPALTDAARSRGITVAQFVEAALTGLDAGEDEIAVAGAGLAREAARDNFQQAFARTNAGR